MTITVRLPDELEARLRARLAQENIAVSEYVRQAITEKLAREPDEKPAFSHTSLGKHLFGKYGSGRTDLSEQLQGNPQGEVACEASRLTPDR